MMLRPAVSCLSLTWTAFSDSTSRESPGRQVPKVPKCADMDSPSSFVNSKVKV
ncbi:hypothetical protein MGG_16618 [Pyricularia oryzae 70-15]|uniref:Uncharacterized protein n=1 Tax=Pyricularia oryzae (strain 70-15 / ATCC MYA-4617 / FGSC 8958) TaxID=242507 RepID=G4N0P5_PYRO7|nr:uncharacterized protein MGG_16618 [Pyricularia oryzae 70-15]EHA51478.1 hypothetical protein MGG_16618 [Pyricularia oryzae 70-15]